MTEKRERGPDDNGPRGGIAPTSPTPEPTKDRNHSESHGPVTGSQSTPGPWGVRFREGKLTLVDFPAMLELTVLLRLDPGGPVQVVVCRPDGDVDSFMVSRATERRIRENLENGPRIPPAVHWRWMHGSPVLEQIVEQVGAEVPS